METLLYLAEPINAVGIFFMIFTAIAFALRLYTKHLNKSSLGYDDFLLFLAILCFDFENGIQTYCLTLARKIQSPVEPLFSTYLEWIWISASFAVPCLTLIKLSILFFYRRIFTTKRWFSICSLLLLIIVTIYGLSGTLGQILQCIPVHANWTQLPPDRSHCMPYNIYSIWLEAYVIVDTILDAIILALPLVMITRLQLPLWKRRYLIAIFLLGGFTVATNIIRLALMNANKADSEEIAMVDELWISVHCGCGILCACLPLYGPLVTRFTSLASSLRKSYAARKSAGSGRVVEKQEARERATGPVRGERSSYIRMENEQGIPSDAAVQMRQSSEQRDTFSSAKNPGHRDWADMAISPV